MSIVYVIFATSEEDMYPKILFPLGHESILVNMIRTILNHQKDSRIYVITGKGYRLLLSQEVKRWFPEKHHITIGVSAELCSLKNVQEVVVLDGDYPPLFPKMFDRFMEKSPIPSVLVAKVKNPHDSYHVMKRIGKDIAVVYGGIMRLPFSWFCEHHIEELLDSLEDFPVYMNDGHLCQHCVVPVKTKEDRVFAEHVYSENRQQTFLNRCYNIWKKLQTK